MAARGKGVQVFDETAEAVASGEKLLKESGTIMNHLPI